MTSLFPTRRHKGRVHGASPTDAPISIEQFFEGVRNDPGVVPRVIGTYRPAAGWRRASQQPTFTRTLAVQLREQGDIIAQVSWRSRVITVRL